MLPKRNIMVNQDQRDESRAEFWQCSGHAGNAVEMFCQGDIASYRAISGNMKLVHRIQVEEI